MTTIDDIRRLQNEVKTQKLEESTKEINILYAVICQEIKKFATENYNVESKQVQLDDRYADAIMQKLTSQGKFQVRKILKSIQEDDNPCNCVPEKKVSISTSSTCSCGAAGQDEGFPCSDDCSYGSQVESVMKVHQLTCSSLLTRLIVSW